MIAPMTIAPLDGTDVAPNLYNAMAEANPVTLAKPTWARYWNLNWDDILHGYSATNTNPKNAPVAVGMKRTTCLVYCA